MSSILPVYGNASNGDVIHTLGVLETASEKGENVFEIQTGRRWISWNELEWKGCQEVSGRSLMYVDLDRFGIDSSLLGELVYKVPATMVLWPNLYIGLRWSPVWDWVTV